MKNTLLKYGLKLSGKDIFNKYDELKKLEFNLLENNIQIQEKKLKDILLHSWKFVPYYTKILTEKKVVIKGKVNLNNFNKIPILKKEIIRNNFEELKSKDPKYYSRKPYLNTSGGSTGEPVLFIQDKNTWTKGMAEKWIYYSFISKKFPCKLLKLWGSERDILKGGYGLKGNFKNWVYNRKFLNSFKMSQEDMNYYVKEINKYKPLIIEAYVQSIYELSKFIKDNNLKIYSPKGIITSAGTLYPDMEKLIKEVFNCPVLNRYGSREVGDIACSCKRDEGLHLNIFTHYLEILNDKLKPCKPGEFGKVYVTTLDNYSMPLIRYDIGDIAIPSKKQKCSCGRGMPLIESVKGRMLIYLKPKMET
jgi:phenylacetate-CoA ligase